MILLSMKKEEVEKEEERRKRVKEGTYLEKVSVSFVQVESTLLFIFIFTSTN